MPGGAPGGCRPPDHAWRGGPRGISSPEPGWRKAGAARGRRGATARRGGPGREVTVEALNSGWYIRAGSLLGIPVRIHASFLAAAAILVVLTPGFATPPVAAALAVRIGVLFVTILAHELGHGLAARSVNGSAHHIEVWFLGGMTHVEYVRRPGAMVKVSLAGVAVNVLLAVLAAVVIAWRGGTVTLPTLVPTIDVTRAVWEWNAVLLALNLLPGVPFDGGGVLEALLVHPLGRARARLAAVVSGAFLCAGLVLAAFGTGNVALAVVGVWGLHSCARAYQEFRARGVEEDLLLGTYDFSRGHAGLEESVPGGRERHERSVPRRRPRDRDAEPPPPADDPRLRLDRLLERIHDEGIDALTPDDRRFLEEESRRLREKARRI